MESCSRRYTAKSLWINLVRFQTKAFAFEKLSPVFTRELTAIIAILNLQVVGSILTLVVQQRGSSVDLEQQDAKKTVP